MLSKKTRYAIYINAILLPLITGTAIPGDTVILLLPGGRLAACNKINLPWAFF